ncbi:MAG: hypothetical protein R8M46_06085 [Ghiorsea sp.]
MLISNGDLLLTALFGIGLFQFFWLSVVLVRKGINPSQVRLSMMVLFSIWVLLWPAYDNVNTVALSLLFFVLPALFALHKTSPFARHLRLGWHTNPAQTKQPTPWLTLLISLGICSSFFVFAPELGLGLGLSFCFAWHAADLADLSGIGRRLGLSKNPKQSLIGHVVLVVTTTLVCAWSLQLYHGIDWKQFLVATLIVGLVGSIIRALIATGWNMPLSVLGMGTALWLL